MMNKDDFDDTWQETDDAIREGDLDTVANLVSKCPSLIHEQTTLGSLLHVAADKGQLPIVQYFVENGADINAIADVGGSPLKRAAAEGQSEVVNYLIAKGCELDVTAGNNALISAITGGHLDVCRILINAGFDVHYLFRSITGKLKSALTHARDRGHPEIGELLLSAGCRMPVEGVDVPANDARITPGDERRERIVAHMAAAFGPVDDLSLQEIVPAMSDVPVTIHIIRPNDKHPFLTLFTTGISFQPLHVPKGQEAFQYAELLLHLPASWPHPRETQVTDGSFWPVQWLRQVAYYPHSNETWLGGPHTIIASDDPPVPLGANTRQTCLLLIADFGGIEPLKIDDSHSIKFYTVMSLFTEERDFENQHGIYPLLQRFDERGISMTIDVDRENVALHT